MKTNYAILPVANTKFMDADIKSGEIIFYDYEIKALLGYDFNSKSVRKYEIQGNFDKTMEFPRRIIRDGNKLYFIQKSKCEVFRFIDKDGYFIYDGKIIIEKFVGETKNAFCTERKIWIIPMQLNEPFAIYDMDTNEVEYFFATALHNKKNITFREVAFESPYLFISYEGAGNLICIDMLNKTTKHIDTGIMNPIEGIALRGNEIVLRECGGKNIFFRELFAGKNQIVVHSDSDYEEKGRLVVMKNGTIVICPIENSEFYYIDEKNGTIERIKSEFEFVHDSAATFTIGSVEYNGKLYIFPWAAKNMIRIEEKDSRIFAYEEPFFTDWHTYVKFVNDTGRNVYPLVENEELGIREFLNFCV